MARFGAWSASDVQCTESALKYVRVVPDMESEAIAQWVFVRREKSAEPVAALQRFYPLVQRLEFCQALHDIDGCRVLRTCGEAQEPIL